MINYGTQSVKYVLSSSPLLHPVSLGYQLAVQGERASVRRRDTHTQTELPAGAQELTRCSSHITVNLIVLYKRVESHAD